MAQGWSTHDRSPGYNAEYSGGRANFEQTALGSLPLSADMLGISEPTVRTQLQEIFAKTGTSRQAKLLLLLRNSTPPIRAPQLSAQGA
ncbi:helix-turn-helix transcriptional regulator [Bosea sp. LC85]|uniref:helix-turn-helix transcriptional regulator n=1 Tax=Bosea sp. LC85 TaxID=1502851 RepID=UPI0005BA76EA|nr:helix-turn-helix transcriptional regulator [Bosea sp. LC85]